MKRLPILLLLLTVSFAAIYLRTTPRPSYFEKEELQVLRSTPNGAITAEMTPSEIEALERLASARRKDWVVIGLSLLFACAGLWIIFDKRYTEEKHWAYAVVGFVGGFWIK